jgi:predicted helicase
VNIGHGSAAGEDEDDHSDTSTPKPIGPDQGAFVFDEFAKAIMAKIVKKCGRRDYWEDWAGDIAKIAQTHITRITALVAKPDTPERTAFDAFLAEIHDDLNDSIPEGEAIEMLAQHLITRPVFDALFEGYSFTKNNPVSRAMQAVLETLDEHNLGKEAESLQKFYDSVKRRAAGIDKADAKQKIIVELYDKFFRNAFPKMTERLGIVYTPVEVVDFIIHSVNEVLQLEFGQTLGSKGVHILDPFTGTGTFITRLLQSGLIEPEELEHKYRNEIHANEIVLLAYYIAAINIEAAYHGSAGGDYVPFEGICLTDTFQLYEQEHDLISDLMADNSNRRTRQKDSNIRVIIGNPPYSEGQKNENDNAENVGYPKLDRRIRFSYSAKSKAKLAKGLYNSYIRAIRWASDRIGDAGVIGFISGSGFVGRNSMDGLRQCLADEFSNIHVLNLRGDIRKNMLSKGRAKEGQNIFGSGSMSGVAITIFVKNPSSSENGKIFYHDIGDDLTTADKLSSITRLKSIAGINRTNGWTKITPDEHGDWLKQRNNSFNDFVAAGDKKGSSIKLFDNFSQGILTARDSWAYNASREALSANMQAMIVFYNEELTRFDAAHRDFKRKEREAAIDDFISSDSTKISWSHNVKQEIARGRELKFSDQCLTSSIYRPFTRQWLYYNRSLNERVYQMPSIFPDNDSENQVICVGGIGDDSGFSVLMMNALPCFHALRSGQDFPRYLYREKAVTRGNDRQGDMLSGASTASVMQRCDAINDLGLSHFQASYPDEDITKDDIFYYVYGLLHSEDYRDRYADNLSKQLPRIPAVKNSLDFWAFVEAGRKLGSLHCEFEVVEPYPVVFTRGDTSLIPPADPEKFYRVEQMKFAGKRPKLDKSTVIYNANITISGIPLEAYDYVVNGKPALEWVMERQGVRTDKDSGIVNDANRYAVETEGDPAYPLKLFQRVIMVSLETMKIVRGLPQLDLGSSIPAKGESHAAE